MGENRGWLGGAEEPRVGPWALEAMPSETGFSAIAAGARSAAQTPRPPEALRARPEGWRPLSGPLGDLAARRCAVRFWREPV
jgi:hypothetical protein